ncbi:MAG: hypothetical protein K6G80_09210 [Treponema sp.]|nr:hypothetical protein [Treponema sp.]
MPVLKNSPVSARLVSAFLVTCILVLSGACSSRRGASDHPAVIWTDRPEVASYVELFNASQDKAKAVVVYKERLANSLPPAKDEQRPDVIIGSWLKNGHIKKNFAPLNPLFVKGQLDPSTLYAPLLEYGKSAGRQYLLPLSFNLPVVIFSVRNASLIPDSYMLTPDEIRDTAAAFNVKNSHDIYTQMGFAPSWDSEFLYTVAKLNGAHFKEKANTFIWDKDSLDKTVRYIREWTESANTSSAAEQDFAFKYLYTPKYRQVDSGRCLYAYGTSASLFSVSYDQLGSIDFRWLQKNEHIPVEDNIVMAGIYRRSYNNGPAKAFVLWLFQESTQKALLERAASMKLHSADFGIAGGFSSVREVTERGFPLYYRTLLGNLPPENALQAPHSFPTRWTSLKDRTIIPYLEEAVRTDSRKNVQPIEERINSWSKQFD